MFGAQLIALPFGIWTWLQGSAYIYGITSHMPGRDDDDDDGGDEDQYYGTPIR